MSDNNKFNFVNDPKEEIITYDNPDINEEDQGPIEDIESSLRQEDSPVRYLRAVILMIILSAGMVYLGLVWQDSYDLMGWGNAFWLAFALQLFFGWVLFVYNRNIFSPLIYAYKSFFLMFVGKKPKVDYYTYTQQIYQNQIPRLYYMSLFISSIILLIPSIITLVILMQG